MHDKVRFGIIGAGMIAGVHAEALKQIPAAELVAVCDCAQDKARAFAAKHNCQSVATLEELLASGVEAVTVATPSGMHHEAVLAAARAGKHILCEKPLEITPKRITEMVEACESAGVLLAAVFPSRFCRAAEAIADALQAGRFGRPTLISASIRWYREPSYYLNAAWRGTWELDGGGALMNQGIHTIDLLTWFGGAVRRVCGRCANILHTDIAVEDTAAATIEFASGALGVVEAGTSCFPG